MKTKKLRTAVAATLFTVGMTTAAFAGQLETSVSIEKKMNVAAAKSQKMINSLSETTRTMLGDYKALLTKIEQNRAYNRQLELLIESQEEEMLSFEKQIAGIEDTERGLAPLMNAMIEALDQFVDLDIPFKLESRKASVKKLRNLMLRADVTTSEKFRRILDAYKYESLYGMDLMSYQDELELGGEKRQVEFLRVGRIAFIHRSRDGKEAAYWDVKTGRWEALSDEYYLAIRNGIRMQQGQMQHDLIKLPIKAAEKSQ